MLVELPGLLAVSSLPQPIPEDDFQLMEDVATGGFWDTPGFREAAKRSIAERQQRVSTYA